MNKFKYRFYNYVAEVGFRLGDYFAKYEKLSKHLYSIAAYATRKELGLFVEIYFPKDKEVV